MEIRYNLLEKMEDPRLVRYATWHEFGPVWRGTRGGLSEQIFRVTQWCEDAFPGPDRWIALGVSIMIRDSDDAIAFKLRWV